MGSHDFIKFPPYRPTPTAPFFALLGEIQALLEQVQRIPVPPMIRDELLRMYLSKAVHGTTAIEGNRLNEDDVLVMVRLSGEAPEPKSYDEQEVRNILDTTNAIIRDWQRGVDEEFSVEQFNQLHKMTIAGTGSPNCDDSEIGAIRRKSVEVGRYLAPPVETCKQLLERYCEWLNSEEALPAEQERYQLAWHVVKAVTAHIYFGWIHPYCDGNGRLSRLIEFKLLLHAGVPPIAAHLLSNAYNKRRQQYHSELRASVGDYIDGSYPEHATVAGFLTFALESFRDELEAQCNEIHNAQITAIWHNLIHSSFPRKLSVAQARRKQLALDLTQPQLLKPVPFREIREITPAVAVAFADASDATLRNDLNMLIDMGLALRTDEGYKPNTDILLGLTQT